MRHRVRVNKWRNREKLEFADHFFISARDAMDYAYKVNEADSVKVYDDLDQLIHSIENVIAEQNYA